MSEEKKLIFKKYEYDEKKEVLFEKCRKEVDPKVSDEILAILICQKKTYEKVMRSWKATKTVIDEVKIRFFIKSQLGFGNIPMNLNIAHFLMKEGIIFNMDTKTKDGSVILFISPVLFFTDKKLKNLKNEDKLRIFLYCMYLILTKTTAPSKGINIVINLNVDSFFTLDFAFIKRFHVMLKKLPIRPQKIVILNAPWFFRMCLAIVKPFMSKKIVSRFGVYTYQSMIEEFGFEVVPTVLKGGMDYKKVKRKVLEEFFCQNNKEMFGKFFVPQFANEDEIGVVKEVKKVEVDEKQRKLVEKEFEKLKNKEKISSMEDLD